MSDAVYLDYAASTPPDPRVLTAMEEAQISVGNPSSVHAAGRRWRTAVDRARDEVARLIGADPAEIIFTSGATESNNAAIAGLFAAARGKAPGRRLRVLASPIEHPSISAPLGLLADEFGIDFEFLPVDGEGRVSAADVANRLTDATVMVCVMWVNNILGTVQPIAEIGRVVAAARSARPKGAPPLYFICDAVQAASWLPIRVAAAGVDALSLSGHKMYGPKGVGALFLRRGIGFRPLLLGGGQEDGRRSGTENVAGVVGLGAAAGLVLKERDDEVRRLADIRRLFVDALAGASRDRRIIGPSTANAAPGIVFLRSSKFSGDVLALKLDSAGVAVSSGSACDAGSRKSPAPLRAVYGEALARQGGIRVSFGRFTRPEDIRRLLEEIVRL